MATSLTKVKEVFENNLRKALKKETQEKLGDRSQYVGASDISGCLRAAYLNKKENVELPVEKLIIFERGHFTEEIVKKMLGNMPYKREVEFEVEFISNDDPFPAKVHIDYVVYNKKEKEITLIEVKSQNNDNFNIYSSYLLQVNFQWLVAQAALSDTNWKVKNAFLVIVNPGSGKYNIVEVNKDENLQKVALEKAKTLRDTLIKNEVPKGEEQLYCSQCPYKNNCETFCKGTVNDSIIQLEVDEILKLEAEAKKLVEIAKNKKEALKKYLQEKGLNKIKAGEHIISITKESSYVTLDTSALKKDPIYEELLKKFKKTNKRASSIRIK